MKLALIRLYYRLIGNPLYFAGLWAKDAYVWLHATDQRTWVGHGVQGFLLSFIHPAFALGAFAHREVSDIIAGKWTRQKRRDCVMDFIYPALGIALQQAVVSLF